MLLSPFFLFEKFEISLIKDASMKFSIMRQCLYGVYLRRIRSFVYMWPEVSD
jgi:hypothetical protein